MKAIYVKPLAERVNITVEKSINGNWWDDATSQWEGVVQDNDHFFAEEEFDDDEYDPFFDE